jgi:hypothetical protein
MTDLTGFLHTDPQDVGCDRAMEVLHLYAEAAETGDAEERMPGVAAHLRSCGPCNEDFHGLLAAVLLMREKSDPTG